MNGTISLKDALAIIDLKDKDGYPVPFDISFRTLQRNSKTGGRLVAYKGATHLTSLPKKKLSNQQIVDDLQRPERTKRNPNHFTNRTRNIKKPNGEIAKVHIRLIVSINNQNVVY